MTTTGSSTRRRHQRIKLTVPATVKVGTHTVAASTKDISVGGMFVFTDTPFREGSDIEIVLMLPKELGFPASDMVCCHGKIVRSEVSPGLYGIAASIEQFQAFSQA